MNYLLVKTIHIISSTLLFGTGIGSAYYMWRAHLARHIQTMAITVKHVVFADWVFTTTTVIIQPLTGAWMVHEAGIPYSTLWVWLSLCLYVLIGLCWLPVVWIQIKIGKITQTCFETQTPLPKLYDQLMWIWFGLGIPAFLSVVGIFFLMVMRPS